MAPARRRGCSPLLCAALSNSASIAGLRKSLAYMAVVISTPCFSSAGAVDLTMVMAWGEAVRIQYSFFCELSRGGGQAAGRWIGISVRRSEEHTSELQSLMRISYAVFCLKKKNTMYK